MILVILGTEQFPFERLVRKMDEIAGQMLFEDEVYVQLGSCQYEPRNCAWKRYIDFGEMVDKIRAAGVVISHAGAGTTLLCLHLGKRPILVPRQKKFGEHVDDHQVSFAQMIETMGYVDVVNDASEIQAYIEKQSRERTHSCRLNDERSKLVHYLDSLFIDWTRRDSSPD